jgi:rod shape determining protein RodA
MARTILDLDALKPRDRQVRLPDPTRRGRRGDPSVFRPRPPAAWKHVDLTLLVCVGAVTALGALMILSSTRGTDPDAYNLSFLARHLAHTAAGVVAMVAVTLVDYRRLRDFAWLPYVAGLVLLGLVASPLGTEIRGTQAWFQIGGFQLQPAELAKVAAVFAGAAYLSRCETPLTLRRLLIALGILGAPMAMILVQPDIGTALVFVAIVMGMLLVGGARMRHIVVLSAVGVIAIVGVLTSDVLEDYQRDRLTTFLEQDQSPREATYNLNQSKIAIGSGGLTGKGLFEGTQTRLGNVPEQHTDFIFTALGEELGFVGSVSVLGLFAVICVRIWRTARIARDRLGALVCVGVLSMIVFQVFQNVGMTMGIMPITGITLPFMSYGGSSIIATLVGIGLVLNVHMRRFG